MSELFEQDLAPLAPQEIERLLKQTRNAAFHLDESAPRKQREDFKKSNLIEIARNVSEEKESATSLLTQVHRLSRHLRTMRLLSIHRLPHQAKIYPSRRKVHLLRLERWR